MRHRSADGQAVDTGRIRLVAGADAAYAGREAWAAVVVMTFPRLEPVESTCASRRVTFPYIPGLLSFREAPALIDAFARITNPPDCILLNGHGYAHPRRFGLASHVGLVLGMPSVGIARRLLTGNARPPGSSRGSQEPVRDGDEVIGMVVRTVEGKRPVVVSAGYRTGLAQAVRLALDAAVSHPLTEPLWLADRQSRRCRDRMRAG